MYGMLCVFAYVDASFWSTSLRGRSILLPTTEGEREGEKNVRGGGEEKVEEEQKGV